MAARPPANPPVLAVVSSAAAASLATLGQQLREALPARRLHSVSVCDQEANVLWLSEGALGPDENSVVIEGLGTLASDPTLPCYETALEDGRCALLLPVRSPTGQLVGVAMILADCKSLGEDTQERLAAAPVRAIMQRLAVLLKPGDTPRPADAPLSGSEPAASEGEEISVFELVPDIAPPAPHAPAGPAAAPPTLAAARPGAIPAAISAEQMDDILEFELPDESPRLPTGRVNGTRSHSKLDSQTDMVSLEFLPEQPVAPAPRTVSTAPAMPEVRRDPTPSAPAASAAAPRGDPNLILEVLPYGKLRSGGQARRFQIQTRLSARVAQCDPAVLDVLILQRLLDWLATHRAVWTSQPTCFTVNLSIATLEDERFAQKFSAELNAHGIAAETLGFEIPEAVCTQRRAQVERFIAQCDKLGAPVVIDDFSFDSQVLPLLRSKAVRLVKIDPKLTASALKDKFSQALVVAIVQAAKVLGIHCAAKRVETQAAAQWLGAIGCDFGQGTALCGSRSLEALVASPDATGLTTLISRPPRL